jgi:hypothetical protein
MLWVSLLKPGAAGQITVSVGYGRSGSHCAQTCVTHSSSARAWPHKAALTAHLRATGGELFGLTYDLVLCDVTSTYFEGAEVKSRAAPDGGADRGGTHADAGVVPHAHVASSTCASRCPGSCP